MKKIFLTFAFVLTSTAVAAYAAENYFSGAELQPSSSVSTPNFSADAKPNNPTAPKTGPTANDNVTAAERPSPTGEGAKNQPTPPQQSQDQPATTAQAMALDAMEPTAGGDVPQPPMPPLDGAPVPQMQSAPMQAAPQVSTVPTPPGQGMQMEVSEPVRPPSMQPAPMEAVPDHSDAPAATQLPVTAQMPEPPNPNVKVAKATNQKALGSMAHVITAQVKSCWKIPKESIGGTPLTAVISVTQAGVLGFEEFTTDPNDKQKPLADSIKTAVTQCSPIKNLPPISRYEEWKIIMIKFNTTRRKHA